MTRSSTIQVVLALIAVAIAISLLRPSSDPASNPAGKPAQTAARAPAEPTHAVAPAPAHTDAAVPTATKEAAEPPAGHVQIMGSGGKCLDAAGGNRNTSLILWDCHGRSNQLWHFQNRVLVSDKTGQCVFLANTAQRQSRQTRALVTADCDPKAANPGMAVRWEQRGDSLVIAPGGPAQSCLDIGGAASGGAPAVVTSPCSGADQQRWRFR